MSTRRPELFEPDPRLRARMVLAVATAALLVLGIVAFLVVMVVAGHPLIAAGVAAIALVGVGGTTKRRIDEQQVDLAPGLQERLDETVQRLCVLADMPAPQCIIRAEILPLSYTVAPPRQPARLYVTVGMMMMLDGHELDAVVAHELSHIANRDATLMTVLAGPGAALKAGAQGFWSPTSMSVSGMVLAMCVGAVIVPLAALLDAASRSVSRRRELNADYGAALLTGSPSSVASVLERVSHTLRHADLPDLRVVAAHDAFHILPTGPEPTTGWGRLGATHPPLATRLAQLDAMERRLQHARLRPDAGL